MIRIIFLLVFSFVLSSYGQQFNADSAFSFLQKQVSFGPRNPNSIGHKKCGEFLLQTLQKYTGDAEYQAFTVQGYGEQLKLNNIIGRFNPGKKDRLLLCAHWDTRPRADNDNKDKDIPIPGANDGASGVAALLEISRVLSANIPAAGIDIVFFDGEDYGLEGDMGQYFHGSRYFSAHVDPAIYRDAILLDMIGDKNLSISREYYSGQYAKDIQDRVWQIAFDIGMSGFLPSEGFAIQDDHLMLNEAGIPAIDIIDFAYPDRNNGFWHTHKDVPENCSSESLFQVGMVLLEYIYTR